MRRELGQTRTSCSQGRKDVARAKQFGSEPVATATRRSSTPSGRTAPYGRALPDFETHDSRGAIERSRALEATTERRGAGALVRVIGCGPGYAAPGWRGTRSHRANQA